MQMQAMRNLLRLKYCPNHPVAGWMMAFETK